MLTNAGIDKSGFEKREREEAGSHAFHEEERAAHEAAQLNSRGATWAAPEILEAGNEGIANGEYSQSMHAFDHAKIRKRQIREAKAYGNLRPAQIVANEGSRRHTNLMRDEFDTEAVVQGVFCWKCTDAVSDTVEGQKLRHAKLRQHLPQYQIPPGLTEMDCCGTCGAVLKVKAA